MRTLLTYHLDDTVHWRSGYHEHRGGRPEQGGSDGRSDAECLLCHGHVFVHVQVRADAIVGVVSDPEQPSYPSSGITEDHMFIGSHHSDEWFLRQGRYDRGAEANRQWFVEIAAEAASLSYTYSRTCVVVSPDWPVVCESG